jgi:hypothetical protein
MYEYECGALILLLETIKVLGKRNRVPMPFATHLVIKSSSWITKHKFFFFYSSSLGSPLSHFKNTFRTMNSIVLLGWRSLTTPHTTNTDNWTKNNPTGIRTHDPSVGVVDVSATVWTLWTKFICISESNSASHCSSKSIQCNQTWHTQGLDGHVEAKNRFVWQDTKNASHFRAACLCQMINTHIRLSFICVWSDYNDRRPLFQWIIPPQIVQGATWGITI